MGGQADLNILADIEFTCKLNTGEARPGSTLKLLLSCQTWIQAFSFQTFSPTILSRNNVTGMFVLFVYGRAVVLFFTMTLL